MRPYMLFLAACLAVFMLDVAVGPQISPWSLYLVPLLLAGWLFGGRAAMAIAVLASLLILIAAFITGHPNDTWWDFALSWCNRAISLLTVGWLVGVARGAQQRRSFAETQQRKE